MAKSQRDGVRGLPKVPTVFKVMWELYINLDIWSPYCLFTETVVNAQYVSNLQQKLRWLRSWCDALEGGLNELAVVAQRDSESIERDRRFSVGDGDTVPEVAVQEVVHEGDEQAPPCEVTRDAQEAPEGAEVSE